MTDLELRRLSAFRAELEGFAAREAALRIRDRGDALSELRTILGRLTRATLRKDYPAFRDADHALHAAIVKVAEVPCLFESWRGVWAAQQAFHERTFEECFPDARFLAEEHEHLVETLALGDPVAAEDAARSHLGAVWFRLDERGGVADPSSLSGTLQRTVAHLGFSLHRPLRLGDVARRVAFTSPGHLSRLFREHYGESFQAYLQRLRLQKAEELLRESRLPVASISRRVGYRDVSRFGQHFKRRFGKSPVRYRDTFQRP